MGEATRPRAGRGAEGMQVEVECATLAEVDEALEAGAPRLLLDNMSLDELREAVGRVAGRADTEASGGVNLDTVRGIAETGVDWISVGALTHSAPALDLSLLLERSDVPSALDFGQPLHTGRDELHFDTERGSKHAVPDDSRARAHR